MVLLKNSVLDENTGVGLLTNEWNLKTIKYIQYILHLGGPGLFHSHPQKGQCWF